MINFTKEDLLDFLFEVALKQSGFTTCSSFSNVHCEFSVLNCNKFNNFVFWTSGINKFKTLPFVFFVQVFHETL